MAMKFCAHGDLGKLLDVKIQLKEKDARFYVCEVILAIEELHKKNVIFRDLKPDNVLLDGDGHTQYIKKISINYFFIQII